MLVAAAASAGLRVQVRAARGAAAGAATTRRWARGRGGTDSGSDEGGSGAVMVRGSAVYDVRRDGGDAAQLDSRAVARWPSA